MPIATYEQVALLLDLKKYKVLAFYDWDLAYTAHPKDKPDETYFCIWVDMGGPQGEEWERWLVVRITEVLDDDFRAMILNSPDKFVLLYDETSSRPVTNVVQVPVGELSEDYLPKSKESLKETDDGQGQDTRSGG